MQPATSKTILTNQQVLDSVKAINMLMMRNDIPAKASYLIAKAARKLDRDKDVILSEIQRIQEKYILRDEAGKRIEPTDDAGSPLTGQIILTDKDAFNAETKELLDIDSNDYSAVFKIPVSKLGDCAVEPAALYSLDWLFIDDLPD